MYNKSKFLSKNKLENVNYIGKDIAILTNVVFFDSIEIIDNKIICTKLNMQKSSSANYKLVNLLKFIYALSKCNKNIYEKCIILFQNVGFPKSNFSGFKNNIFIVPDDFIKEIEKKFEIFQNIDTKKIKDINKISNDFSISFTQKHNPTYLTDYIMVATSENIFNIAWYSFLICSNSKKLYNSFICSECGNIYQSNSNKQKYCKHCCSQIDFPKISNFKNYKQKLS